MLNNNQIIEKWLYTFGKNIDPDIVSKRVTSDGNFLWHIFTWGNANCLEKIEAKKAFDELQYTEAIMFYGGFENSIENVCSIGKIFANDLDKNVDVYVVAKDFSWTYVQTHEDSCGPYYSEKEGENL